jgi:hypothetical protein
MLSLPSSFVWSTPMKRAVPVLLAAVALSACAGVGSNVQTTPLGEAGKARAANCPLDILYQPPARPYEPIASFSTHLTAVPAAGAPEALRRPACELGADAVIVTRNQVLNVFDHTLLEGTAIRYVQAPVAPPPEQKQEAPAPDAPGEQPLRL